MTNQELVALLKKNPVGVGCGVLTLLLAAGIYFRSGSLPEAVAALEQKTAEGQRLAANLQNAAQLNEQLAAVTAASREIDARLVHADELATNLQYFYRLEAATGVKLIELRQNPLAKAAAKGTLTPIGYAVSAQGDYRALVEFLRQMENGARFCRVITASLAPTTLERTDPLRLVLTVELLGLP
jgi:hypothetical protein